MPKAPSYPLFLNVAGHPILVVGGGTVALRKTKSLLECAASVTIVSSQFNPGFDKLIEIERLETSYAATHMARKPWRLVFAATDAPLVNDQVQKHAAEAGILCCRSDDPDAGDFASGATAHLGGAHKAIGGITVAVSTAGASPLLAARICKQAAESIDPILPVFADLLNGWRDVIKSQIPSIQDRRHLLQRLAGEEMETIVRKSGAAAAQRFFEEWLAASGTPAAAIKQSSAS
ncbi:MAG TPA: bifunctional precorrin-2 dehydrogenase/sirohydrochlorin ferrochelatase [Phycisphaerae bacterium]|jgi:precorrin-2 dehydrogenase/sirohydrochlorin ferrochelatase